MEQIPDPETKLPEIWVSKIRNPSLKATAFILHKGIYANFFHMFLVLNQKYLVSVMQKDFLKINLSNTDKILSKTLFSKNNQMKNWWFNSSEIC